MANSKAFALISWSVMGNTLRGWDSPAQAERFVKSDYTSPGGF
jgi:hypothetical protein